MATNVDTAVTVAARKGQIFTMSDGNLVAIYYNGTAWGYRIKASGTWGARTALTSSPAQTGAVWAQDGNNLFGAVSGPSFFYIYKLAYASGSVTQTNTLTGDNGVVVAGYIDTTNARFNVPIMLSNAGIYLYSFATSNLAVGINASQITAGSPPTTLQTDVTWAAAGAGAGTWQIAWCATTGATAFNVVTMVTTTTAITSQTAETSVPALAANCAGLDAIYDGTDVVFAANQNNAALRWSRRTAANTYAAWTTLVTETIAGRPALARKGTGAGSDLAVFYRSNASQANGQIAAFKRISGTWDASKTTVAGAAATGWLEPVARADTNQGTAGTVPLAYLTGTANPWTLVEDSFLISSGSAPLNITAVTGTATAAGGTDALTVILDASGGTAAATGGTVTTGSVTNLSSATGTASAAGGTDTLTVRLASASGTASASGPTVTGTVTLDEGSGTATAAGGTVNLTTGSALSLTAAAGTATATGGTGTLAATYTISTGTGSAAGGSVSLVTRWTLTAGAATAAGGTSSPAYTYTTAAGAATASGGSSTASTTGGPLSAITGNATAAGGTDSLAVLWTAATGTATAAGGTASYLKTYELAAITGNATAGAGTVTARFTWTAAAGTSIAAGGFASASSFVPTLGHIDGSSGLLTGAEGASALVGLIG